MTGEVPLKMTVESTVVNVSRFVKSIVTEVVITSLVILNTVEAAVCTFKLPVKVKLSCVVTEAPTDAVPIWIDSKVLPALVNNCAVAPPLNTTVPSTVVKVSRLVKSNVPDVVSTSLVILNTVEAAVCTFKLPVKVKLSCVVTEAPAAAVPI